LRDAELRQKSYSRMPWCMTHISLIRHRLGYYPNLNRQKAVPLLSTPSTFRSYAATGLVLACWVVGGGAACGRSCAKTVPATSAAGREGVSFYKSGKPYTRWWWFATQIQKQDIVAELDWVKQKGFGGVEVAWIYPSWWSEEERAKLSPPPKWLSPEWSELVAYAKQYAERIGLGCDFTFGSAWPMGDTQVKREDAEGTFDAPEAEQHIRDHWEHPEEALVIDHLSRRAFDRYAERTGKALAPALRGTPSGLFCDSLELTLRPFWTAGFDREFEQRFGYDIKPFLETLHKPANNEVRYDYLKLISEDMIERFYRPFTETAHKLGAFSRAQVAGAPVDLLTAYAAADVPETEVMLYEPAFGQIVASAAALAGRRDVSSETFTCAYGFPNRHHQEEQTADLKLIADAIFANGVNQVFWHGKPFNARDGKGDAEFFATVHVGEKGALSEELPAFNAYMEKVCKAMKRGRVYSSVAVYLPTEDAWMAPDILGSTDPNWEHRYPAYTMNYTPQASELKGWRPLWINREFLKRGTLEGSVLRVGEQVFSILYLDVYYLDDEALDTILALARAGLPVCLKRPPHEPGRTKSPTFEARVQELQALANVSANFSSVARAKALVAGENLPDFWARIDGSETIIFFANPRAQNLHLPLHYGQALANKDVERPVEITVGGRTIAMTLVFKPYQSILLTIDGNGTPSFADITFQPKTPVVETP